MNSEASRLTGRGLFSGKPVTLQLSREGMDGPLTFVVAGRIIPIDRLVPSAPAGARTSFLAGEGIELGCVEHLFAALGGLGLGHAAGLRVSIDEAELPLMDGGAADFCRALAALDLRPAPFRRRVTRSAEIRIGDSVYTFEPAGAVHVEIELVLDDPRLATTATWNGEASDFIDRIAPARTFATDRDLAGMDASKMTATVDPDSVVVIGADCIHASGRPFSSDEPARHKLLDLIGDLTLTCGNVPRGRIHAHRPGHAATHAAIAEAISRGILV